MSEPAFGKWEPMETALKDGTAFLGFLPQFAGYASDMRVQRCVWSGWGGQKRKKPPRREPGGFKILTRERGQSDGSSGSIQFRGGPVF